jgi:hypothetical protein
VKSLRNGWWSIVASVIATIGILVWALSLNAATDPFSHGLNPWWRLDPVYFWAVWLPILGLNLYAIAMVVIRQITLTLAMVHLFRHFKTTQKLLHFDKCDGYSPVGDFALKIGIASIVFGVWVSAVIMFPWLFFHESLNFKFDTIGLLCLYAIMVPVSVLLPVWGAHLAMRAYKENELNEIAAQIRSYLDNVKLPSTEDSSHDPLKRLRQKYELLEH